MIHVLVIDDSVTFTNGICSYLENSLPDCVTTACYTGMDAMEVLSRKYNDPINCIIMDLVLPCKKGGALLEAILKLAPDVPLVIITGHGNSELRKLLLEEGAQAVIYKPALPEEVVQAIMDSIARMVHILRHIPNRSVLDSTWKKSELIRKQIDKLLETGNALHEVC